MTKSKTSTRTPNRIVLGIDPGFDRVGIAVLDHTETVLYSHCITTNPKADRPLRLKTIGNELKNIIKEWKPTELAIEKLFFNQNVSTALGVAEARGVILYEAVQSGLTVSEYSPQDIKIAVTGYGKASKVEVERMVEKLVKLPARKRLDDELDAIALGITHLATSRGILYK